jgi:hypothetical protein
MKQNKKLEKTGTQSSPQLEQFNTRLEKPMGTTIRAVAKKIGTHIEVISNDMARFYLGFEEDNLRKSRREMSRSVAKEII